MFLMGISKNRYSAQMMRPLALLEPSRLLYDFLMIFGRPKSWAAGALLVNCWVVVADSMLEEPGLCRGYEHCCLGMEESLTTVLSSQLYHQNCGIRCRVKLIPKRKGTFHQRKKICRLVRDAGRKIRTEMQQAAKTRKTFKPANPLFSLFGSCFRSFYLFIFQ